MLPESLPDSHRVVFLGGIIPDCTADEIYRKSSGPVQFAADALQKSFIDGLSALSSGLHVVNLPFIGSWPKRYSSLFSPDGFKSNGVAPQGGYTLENVRFLNLTMVKNFDRYAKAKRALIRLCRELEGHQTTIAVYSLHTSFLKAAVSVRRKFRNVKVVVIVPDLPEYMGGDMTGAIGFLRRKNIGLQNRLLREADGFIALTEAMKERLVTDNRPFSVIEGIYNTSGEPGNVEKEKVKTILYCGTLARRYNVMNLVNAVRKLHRKDFVLEIYGDGGAREEIERISSDDNRIKYCGQKPRAEILKRQREATLLVNPRTAEGDFTKYSFPSKTMEYLASGTPALIYRLPGIPEEYYRHCFSFSEPSVEALSGEIDRILSLPSEELEKMGGEAREFVLTRKNPIMQTGKLIELIRRIHNN